MEPKDALSAIAIVMCETLLLIHDTILLRILTNKYQSSNSPSFCDNLSNQTIQLVHLENARGIKFIQITVVVSCICAEPQ